MTPIHVDVVLSPVAVMVAARLDKGGRERGRNRNASGNDSAKAGSAAVIVMATSGRRVTPAAAKKMWRLVRALSAENLRALAISCKLPYAHSRQLPDLVDELIAEHHDALLDEIEHRINEAAKEISTV